MKLISSRRFEALFYLRDPRAGMMYSEMRYYESTDTSNLAIVVFDKNSKDFGYLIFGRDRRKLFRGIDAGDSFSTLDAAEEALFEAMKDYETDGKVEYPQGDEKKPIHDIFAPIVADDKQHLYFKILISNGLGNTTRNMMQEIGYSFVDVDGNYIQQFQSTGFNQRLWELFLHVLFNKSGFEIDNSESTPDFALSKFGMPIFVEAVTVGENSDIDIIASTGADVAELSKDYMPIKFGSTLFSKLNRKKKYWEMPHVAGHPFVLAIHDYHGAAKSGARGSMAWSRAGLINYLYGVRDDVLIEGEMIRPHMIVGRYGLEPVIKTIVEHTYGEKTIRSFFFAQLDAEHVSAVLFSNGATTSTFGRMGKLAGLGDHDITMHRMGFCIGEDGLTTEHFQTDVDADGYDEAWGDTVTMFHNPWAKNPIQVGLFPNISHVFFDPRTRKIYYKYLPKHVLTSTTFIGVPE